MKLISSSLLIGTCLSLCQSTFGQKSDIGVTFTNLEGYQLGLNYRVLVKEKSHLRFGVFMGHIDRNLEKSDGTIVAATDSIVTRRVPSLISQQYTVKTGVDLRLYSSAFYFSGDLFFGYKKEEQAVVSDFTVLNEQGKWGSSIYSNYMIPLSALGSLQGEAATVNRHYFTYRVLLSINMEVPIKDKLLLHLSAGTGIGSSKVVKTTDYLNPYGEDEVQTSASSVIDLDTQLSIGLTYPFGKRDS